MNMMTPVYPSDRQFKDLLRAAAIPTCPDCGGVMLTDVRESGLYWPQVKHMFSLCPGCNTSDSTLSIIARPIPRPKHKYPDLHRLDKDPG